MSSHAGRRRWWLLLMAPLLSPPLPPPPPPPPPGEGAGSVGDDALGRRESVDSLCGEGAVLPGRGDLTTVTSEGYGEATLGTCERLVRLLMRLTECVPAMEGWGGGWNLDADATLLDIGSGYGKVVVHAKLLSRCRAAHGLECVRSRVEISNLTLQGLYGELDRKALDDDLLRGVSFCCADATREAVLRYTHIYAFDRVFSQYTLAALARLLQRSHFFVFVSSKGPRTWWRHGLSKVQPVAKMRFVTTGRERCTVFIYVNAQFVPGV
mmetsp:Transcript_41291/g.133227  ORF Transcript_41291/g.133227 Transcript_41291/m.133227 type:complete len:267 (-) Transcript_41291:33-833(-)